MPQGPSGNKVHSHSSFSVFKCTQFTQHTVEQWGLKYISSLWLRRGSPLKTAIEPPWAADLRWALGSRWKKLLPLPLAVWGNCLYCCEAAEIWTAAMFGLEACRFKLLIPHCSWLDRRVPWSCWALPAFHTLSKWIKERIHIVSV